MKTRNLRSRITILLLAVLMTVTFMPGLSFMTGTTDVYAATSVSDVFEGLPVTATPGTGTTQWTATADKILKSGNAGKSYSTSTLTLTFTADTHISFEYKVSSEKKYDKFSIMHGSTALVKDASGEVDWTGAEADVKSGDTMVFTYSKDSGGNGGDDTCYLRNFSAGEALVVTFHNGSETREQKIYGGKGTLQTNTFTRTGQVFAGWAESADGTVKYPDGADITLNSSIDLYAVWDDAYTVTFDNNGSTDSVDVARNTAIGTAKMPADPTRKGYTFGGWYNKEDRLTKDTVIKSDVTYTAKWTPVTYTVRFDANGGTGTMDSITATYDQEVVLPKNGFTRSGYTFVGWGTSGSSKTYGEDQTVSNLKSRQDDVQTLYAVWAGNDVAVTVDLNYDTDNRTVSRTGVVGSNYNYISSGSSAKYSELKDPTRDGWNFKGWFDAAEGGYTITSQYKFTAEDALKGKTLYAHWAQAVTLTFDANGGSCYVSSKSIDRGTAYGSLPSASLDGKVFDGWYTAAEGGQKIDPDTVFNENTRLYAHYRNYQNRISFSANGGEGSMEPLTVENGVTARLPKCTFTRDGYKFVKWCTSSSPSNWSKSYDDEEDYIWNASYGDGYGQTLYAVWEETVFHKAFTSVRTALPEDDIVRNTGSLKLPTEGDGYKVSYKSSDTDCISDTGDVTALPLMGTVNVTITATVTDTSDNSTQSKDFVLTVYSEKAIQTTESLNTAAASLTGNLTPVFGTDTDATEIIRTRLKNSGYENITISVKEKSEGRYSSIDKDGTIHYYFNPAMSGNGDYFYTTFLLSRDGITVEKQMYTLMPWDQKKVSEVLQSELDRITFPSEPVTKGGLSTLPRYPVKEGVTSPDYSQYDNFNGWATVTWTSDDSSVVKVGDAPDYPYYSPYAVTVNPKAYDKEVRLTATIRCNSLDAVTVTKDYTVTVKGTSENANEALEAELQEKLDKGMENPGLTDFSTGRALDTDHVTDNIQFPTTRDFRIDGKYQPVTITSSNEDVIEPWKNKDGEPLNNAASVKVYRPLPGKPPVKVTITVTITDKATGVKVSRNIDVTVQPLTQEELETAKALMKKAVSGYWDGIRNNNTAKDNITGDLQSFQEINADNDGSVSFIYRTDEKTWTGVSADTYVENPDGGNDNDYRRFNSSEPSVIADSNLLVSKPEYDTEVTVDSYLTHEVYGKYFVKARKDGDKDAMSLFAGLYRQHAEATMTVRGEKGADPNPDAGVSVSFRLLGQKGETLLNLRTVSVKKNASAFDVLTKALKENGYSYTGSSGYISAITTPSGKVLAQKEAGDNSGWMYKVNGELTDKTLGEMKLQDGDEMVFFYTSDYTAKTAVITFDSDGGSKIAAVAVGKGQKIAAPAVPEKDGYNFAGWYDAAGNKFDFNTIIEDDLTLKAAWSKKDAVKPNPEETAEKPLLQARSVSQTKKSLRLQWKKISGAASYTVYASRCDRKKNYKKVTSTRGLKTTVSRISGKKLRKGTYYKMYVVAKDSRGRILSKSLTVHVTTDGGKYTNPGKLSLQNASAIRKKLKSMKPGQTCKVSTRQTLQSKKLKFRKHRGVVYESSDPSVATVSSSGKIRAVKAGSCSVYAYAQNGVYVRVTVTVR